MPKKITTIIFDWAGVFCTPAEPFAHQELQRRLGLTPAQIEAKVIDSHKQYYRGEISSRKFWGDILNFFNIKDLSQSELTGAYLSSYKEYPEMLLPPKKLKQNYKVALLSNLTEEMMRHILKKYNLKNSFHQLIFSNQVGLLKPGKEIFQLTLKRLRSKPAETLFIDDSLENIKAAEKLGMQTIHFTSPAECLSKLKKFGISVTV